MPFLEHPTHGILQSPLKNETSAKPAISGWRQMKGNRARGAITIRTQLNQLVLPYHDVRWLDIAAWGGEG
jgi:hypothetical protein